MTDTTLSRLSLDQLKRAARIREQLDALERELARILKVESSNGVEAVDPLYRFHLHATKRAKPLTDREMDRIVYGY
jgi:hypothetical protein